MSPEIRITDYDATGGGDDCRVTEWEAGLPNIADLPPLSQFLISPELASAFSITPEPHRSTIDVDRACGDTLSSLRTQSQQLVCKINDFRSVSDDRDEEVVVEGEETVDLTGDGSPERKLRRVGEEDDSMKTSKRIRLVWTPQLHKRFVEVVAHLGVKNAVPKTIMQLMNVEGLSRENVASHLQKYRLYVKRMQGFETEGSLPADHLFGSTPVSKSLRDSGGGSGNENRHAPALVPIPMPYPPQQIVPSSAGGASGGGGAYGHGFEYHSHPYNMMMQPKDWSGNNFGSGSPYQHRVTPSQK